MCPKPLAKRSGARTGSPGMGCGRWPAWRAMSAEVSTDEQSRECRDDTGVLPGATMTARTRQTGFTHRR